MTVGLAGMFGIIGVFIGWVLTRHDNRDTIDRRDAITLAEVAGGMSRLSDGQTQLWEVADQVRQDVAYIAGALGVALPVRR